jgi:hypothetical protein
MLYLPNTHTHYKVSVDAKASIRTIYTEKLRMPSNCKHPDKDNNKPGGKKCPPFQRQPARDPVDETTKRPKEINTHTLYPPISHTNS